ncbi:unnamed protein product [Camellia sinensis]
MILKFHQWLYKRRKSLKKKRKSSKEVQSNASDDEGCNESNPMSSTTKPSKLNIVHGVRERENYVKQYMSNIVSLINLTRDTRFTERHITTLKRTPFGMLFKSFWKKEDVVLKKFNKVDDNVMNVIKSYDFHAKGFKLGGKTCNIRDNDVTLIFEIKSRTKKVDVSYGSKQESAFVQRKFRNMSRISVKSL